MELLHVAEGCSSSGTDTSIRSNPLFSTSWEEMLRLIAEVLGRWKD